MIDHLHHRATLEAELEEMLIELGEDDESAWDAFAEDWIRRAAEYCRDEHADMAEYSTIYFSSWIQITGKLPSLVRSARKFRSDPVVGKMLDSLKQSVFFNK